MPDIENSRKNSRKGCRVGHGKTAENSWKNARNTRKTAVLIVFSGVSGVFPAVFRLFYRDPLGTLFGCFFGCFQCRAFGTSVAGRRDCNTKIYANLVFQVCISLLRCFRASGAPARKILVYPGMLPCLVPSCPQIIGKFVSCSDLILISFWITTMPWIFQPISFYRRASCFVVFKTNPDLPFLASLELLASCFCKELLVFSSVLPVFPRDLGLRLGRKILVFSVDFLAIFQESKERKIRESGASLFFALFT